MNFTTGKISDHIRQLAIPTSIGFFFNTMYNVVDTYFAGVISTDALAALSISFPVFFIMIACVNGLSTGASALISNALGKEDKELVNKITAQVLSFSFVTYILILPGCLLVSPYLFKFLGAEDQYLDMAVLYMNIIFLGSLFFMLLYAANSILMSHGNSLVIRNYLVVGFFLNTLLNPWFIYGWFGFPVMGFAGIAIATVVVMFFGSIYIIWEVYKQGYFLAATYHDFLPNPTMFAEIARQSIPASLNMMTIGTGIFMITYFVKNFGVAAVAAYGICLRIEQIALLPTIGLSIAALSIIGQNNGAGRLDRVKETIHISLFYGFIVIAFGALGMYFFPHFLMQLFTNDPHVIETGVGYLRISAFTSAAYIILSVNISALQGMKRPAYPVMIGLMRQIIIPATLFYLLTEVMDFGIESIWKGIFSINWTAAVVTFFYCRYILRNN
jgi:putative MATE family efflux protein